MKLDFDRVNLVENSDWCFIIRSQSSIDNHRIGEYDLETFKKHLWYEYPDIEEGFLFCFEL